MNTKKHYQELVELTRQLLLNEYDPQLRLSVSAENYDFFRDFYQKASQSPIQVKSTTQAEKITSPPPQQTAPQIKTQAPLIAQKAVEVTSVPAQLNLNRSPAIKDSTIKNQEIKTAIETPNKTPPNLQTFTLETTSIVYKFDAHEMKQLMKTVHPQHPIHDHILPDQQAQKIKNAWQNEAQLPSIAILSFNNQDSHLTFLNHLAHAISLYFGPTQVLSAPKWEQEGKWDKLLTSNELKLIVASDHGLHLLPNLMKHYKEKSKTAKYFIGKTPLILLADISSYLKEYQLKQHLWKAICSELQTTNANIGMH